MSYLLTYVQDVFYLLTRMFSSKNDINIHRVLTEHTWQGANVIIDMMVNNVKIMQRTIFC